MIDQPAILLCGEDTESSTADALLHPLADRLRAMRPGAQIGTASIGTPSSVTAGLTSLADAGAHRIVCLPVALFDAGPVRTLLPVDINRFTAAHSGIEVSLGRGLGVDPKILHAVRARIGAALDGRPQQIAPAETLLMLVGHGTGDADADADLAKITRLVWEGLGLGWAETCFAGAVQPSLADSFARALRLGFKRIVVSPYLLLGGPLVEGIRAEAERIAGAHPQTDIVVTEPLGDDPKIAELLYERIDQALAGGEANAMNCQMCTFRIQVLGDGAVAPQHHHGHQHHGHTHGKR